MVRCSIFFVLADGSKLGDAGSNDSGLRHLETQKKGECECECECLGVKKFQMVRCSIFFVLADGSELGDAGSGDGRLRERQKKRQVEGEVEELRHRREREI